MLGLDGTTGNPWIDRQLAFWSPGWVLAGTAVAVLAARALRRPVARAARMPTWAAGLTILWIGVVLTWTVSPRSAGDRYFRFDVTERACTVWRADIAFAVTTVEWQTNLLLLAPIGVLAATASNRRRRAAVLGLAAALPLAVELVQYAVLSLNRVCSGTDVVTNWVGLVSAFGVGRVVVTMRRRRVGQRGRPASGESDVPIADDRRRSVSDPKSSSVSPES